MTQHNENDEGIEAVARALLQQEGEQIVRDMAGHVGDEVHAVLKRHGMMMRTTGGAVALGILASLQLLAEAVEFGRRSMDGDVDDEQAITAASISLFFAEAKTVLPDVVSLARAPATTPPTTGDAIPAGMAATIAGQCDHLWAYAPTVGNYSCVRCHRRAEHGTAEHEAITAALSAAISAPLIKGEADHG